MTETETKKIIHYKLIDKYNLPICGKSPTEFLPHEFCSNKQNEVNCNDCINSLKTVMSKQKVNHPEPKEEINHPSHYNEHPSGVECIEVVRYFPFNTGSAIAYIWRAGLKLYEGCTEKESKIKDLKKAIWHLQDEISELEK
ncbi:MAG: DUF3310 domain-containing protein [Nitrososphaeraceae archaeon]|nr:DUF3310 domain-containing protein [Nitrososphaeraceae archaeon]